MTNRLKLLVADTEPCLCCACLTDRAATCDRDPEGVELAHVAQGVYGAFQWAIAIAFAAFVAIAYLLVSL